MKSPCRLGVLLLLLGRTAFAAFCLCTQIISDRAWPAETAGLSRDYYKNGEATLRAFEPVSRATRRSVVKLDVDGRTVALAAVIDTNGLAVTKASEIKEGNLTCWLATGQEVAAELLSTDEETDLALLNVAAKNLVPIQWTSEQASVGQCVVTPGIADTPQAVGIVSVPPRKIRPPRALIGVQLDQRSSVARIAKIMAGLGAERAGLQEGDVVEAVNGEPIEEAEALVKSLREFREGQTVKLRVRREDQQFDAAVKMMVPKPEGGWRGADAADRMNRMGSEPSRRAEGFALAIQHDTVLQAWQCGGPLVNLEGKAVGLNIARAGRVASYALPADLVRQAIPRLKAQARAHERATEKLETTQPPHNPAQ